MRKTLAMLGGAAMLAVMALSRFGFNPLALFRAAADQYGGGVKPNRDKIGRAHV